MDETEMTNVGVSRVSPDELEQEQSGFHTEDSDDKSKKDTSKKDEKHEESKHGNSDNKNKKKKTNADDEEKNVAKNDKQQDEDDDDNDSDIKHRKHDLKDMASKAAVAGGAARAVSLYTLISKFFLLMRMFMTSAIVAAKSLFGAISGAVMGAVHTIIGGITSCVSWVTASVTHIVITGVSAVTLVSVVGGAVTTQIQSSQLAKTDGAVQSDCSTELKYALGGVNATALVGDRLKTAQQIYSVFKQYGLADYNIAGILANFDAESGIDPSAVETIHSEPFSWGPRKQHAEAVGFDISRMSSSYSDAHTAINLCGIGLGQWTNGRNTMLRTYAESANVISDSDSTGGTNEDALPKWCNLGIQLSFMIAPTAQGGDTSSAWLASWAPESNASQATTDFCRYWEGNTREMNNPARVSKGPYYATEIQSWTVNIDYAASVIAMSNYVQADASSDAIADVSYECERSTMASANNSSIGAAAVSFAYENKELGKGNNGTPLYQKVHDVVLGSNYPYMDCGCCVSSAVRWSGVDDNYPRSGTGTMLAYLATSPKWVEVAWHGDPSALAPGDILIIHSGGKHHTLVYTGHDLIQAKYPDAPEDYAYVSASQNERSPGCEGWGRWSDYRVFRNVQKESNSKYVNAALTDTTTDD